ncbi:DNA repair protein Rev1 [Battus philenor]|uniref:DNA repair protein Rev1 n=1 Tax=Battus philenor TaxID=42288 RepID=UPI0035CFAB9A
MRRRGERFPDNGFEAWGGYMQAKIAKLEDQFSAKGENQVSNIFNGVAIYVNGFTKPSANELKELMSQHGGVYHTYQRSNDYIIASNLPDTKVKNMSLVKVVRPEWITDSIAANRLLDYRHYLLYKNSRTQPQLNQFLNNNLKNELIASDTLLNGGEDVAVKEQNISNLIGNNPLIHGKQPSKTLALPSVIGLDTVSKSPITTSEVKKSDSVAKTAVDPNFITEFYNNSRLHHISQLGAYFKQHVNDLRDNNDFFFPERSSLKSKIQALHTNVPWSKTNFDSGKIIMHIDMDCFFVSVGLRKRPDLHGKPVAVTHSKGAQGQKRAGVDRATEFNLYKQRLVKKFEKTTDKPEEKIVYESKVGNMDEDDEYASMSEIASCSYEARAKGIKNGMFMGAALKLCPDLKTIPYDFEGYKEVAYTLYNTVAQYTLDIEAVSCDEMYVDCTELINQLNVSVQDFATELRQEIKSKTGCPCSTGFGGNRLQARLATKKAKPDGQFFLTSDLVEDFMVNINLRELPGVGRQTALKLESLGHQTCGSLQTLTLGLLQRHLGNKTGLQLFNQCRGRDSNPLTFHTVRKSVSAEVNYGIRFENNDQCFQFLKQLSAEVHSRMQQFKVVGKCVTLKMMIRAEEAPVETAKFMGHGFCNVINKSTSLPNFTNDVEIITKEVISLCKKQKIDPKEMRGIGIQVSKLESTNSKPCTNSISKFLNKNTAESYNPIIKCEDKDLPHKKEIRFQQEKKFPITPKKENVAMSPTKKSPKLGITRSSLSKKRGRPPKSSKNISSTSKNLIDKFIFEPIQVTDSKQIKKEPEVLQSDKNTKCSDSTEPGLISLPWEKVRELLRAWLDSGQSPKHYDTKMISSYLSKLVFKKNIDKVYILMNFLRRRTLELKIDIWMDVYDHVLKEVQNSMITVYGKKLYLDY